MLKENRLRFGGVVLLLIAGCAAFQNTPAQERVLVADRVCQTEVPGYRVQMAYPDGRWRYYGSDMVGNGARLFNECIRRETERMRGNGQ
jgi:hypothetical protein